MTTQRITLKNSTDILWFLEVPLFGCGLVLPIFRNLLFFNLCFDRWILGITVFDRNICYLCNTLLGEFKI
jgi:hypothetical protein